MKIHLASYNTSLNINSNYSTNTSFKSVLPVETIKNCNIGMMKNGYIGKVQVMKANGELAYLNVFKSANSISEIYFLRDSLEQAIGFIELKIKKFQDYDKFTFPQDPSHVFVETLRNFSNSRTPYYTQGLEEYKNIGTRLMQIAQRRSDEAMCNGNIELISKNESLNFYKKIGFKNSSTFWGENPNKMFIPPEAKEPLSKKYGGL